MAVPIVYQNFVPPAIDAGNLNTVNNVIYTVIGNGTLAPLNASDVRNNIGLGPLATQTVVPVANGGTGLTIAPPVFSAFRNSTIALPDAVATEVVINQVEFDSLGTAFNTTTGRYTPTVSGYYAISLCVAVGTAGGFSTNFQVSLYKNGTPYKRGFLLNTNSIDNANLSATVSAVVFLNGTTDSVSAGIFSDISAGTQTIVGEAAGTSTFISGHFIRS